MPPLAGKGKSKGRSDARRSRSRNTTPSSVLSAGTAPIGPASTAFLEVDTSKLLAPNSPSYSDVLEKLGNGTTIPDPKQFEQLLDQLKTLSDLAEARSKTYDAAIRELHLRRKDVEFEQREHERIEHETEARKAKAKKNAEDAEDERGRKAGKLKKRKERSNGRDEQEERPLAHGAHGLARQDGGDIKEEEDAELPIVKAGRTPRPVESPSPAKKTKASPGTSSLSEMAVSPPEAGPDLDRPVSPAAKSDVSMDSDMSEQQPKPAAPVMTQAYFPDPLAPDPVIYHIREVTEDMTDEEKKEIYSVAAFPTKDLTNEIAGIPPDKDFSNAKPTNQVSANTFLTYIEPYLRPLTEEDVAFLRERGDRTTPFLAVSRWKKHYSEIWADEDGTIAVGNGASDQFPANQARGSIEDVNDDTAATDQNSLGPIQSRLLALMRFTHQTPPGENGLTNGHAEGTTNGLLEGDSTMDLDLPNGDMDSKPLPPAAAIPDLTGVKAPSQTVTGAHADERIKLELRHLGFLGQEDVPDYEGHHDDDISERLRLLQAELKKTMVTNGARKARLLDIAKERMAFQEYNTIHEDLDSQVQQAYLKRTRTLGKSKKGQHGKPKAGGAGGGSHAVQAGAGANKGRDIGDMARMLIDRRKRWADSIGPVFEGMNQDIPGKDTTLWDQSAIGPYEKAEAEGLEDEAEAE